MTKLALLRGEEEETQLPRRPDDSEAEAASWGEQERSLRESPETRTRSSAQSRQCISVHAGGAGVNFLGPQRCQQTDGSDVMSLIGDRWRRDQWRGCAMDAILAAF